MILSNFRNIYFRKPLTDCPSIICWYLLYSFCAIYFYRRENKLGSCLRFGFYWWCQICFEARTSQTEATSLKNYVLRKLFRMGAGSAPDTSTSRNFILLSETSFFKFNHITLADSSSISNLSPIAFHPVLFLFYFVLFFHIFMLIILFCFVIETRTF